MFWFFSWCYEILYEICLENGWHTLFCVYIYIETRDYEEGEFDVDPIFENIVTEVDKDSNYKDVVNTDKGEGDSRGYDYEKRDLYSDTQTHSEK
jgi:hypothetical protein